MVTLTRQDRAPSSSPERRGKLVRFLRRAAPLFYILPALGPLVLFTYWPLLRTLQFSLYDWNMVSPTWRFVGATNYTVLLANEDFWWAGWTTLLYVVGMLIFSGVIPLFLAVLLTRAAGVLLTTYKVILFSPAVISFAVAAITWLWIFNPIDGVLNRLLLFVGVAGPAWLNAPRWVIPAILLISAWKLLGYNLVIFAAGLAGIPGEYYDAAKVDGASPFQQFWCISWPLLTPTTFFVLVTTVIYAGQQTLIPIQILTQGGPNKASTNLVYLIFQYGFQFFETGPASALAAVVFLLFTGITLVQQRLLERFVHYEV
jgi:sn-glycerol 3-phosphate transport system permease protein